MKRFLRAGSAALILILLGWYFSPGVYRILHLPDCIDPHTDLSAAALSVNDSEARFVRESGDERLAEASGRRMTVSLFGLLPLKTVTMTYHTRSVCVGGEAVGVILKTSGVQIVGFERIDTDEGNVCPAVSAGLREGDMICAVNGQAVTNSDRFALLCQTSEVPFELACRRDGRPFTAILTPVKDRDGIQRIGAWVRDSTSGIGTLSFYDPVSGAYAALGHGVTDVDTQKLISPATGFLTEASILRVRKGNESTAGELIGRFSLEEEDAIASVDRNTAFGISGRLTPRFDSEPCPYEIAPSGAAHKGEAFIRSTVDGNIKEYAVQVIRVDVQSSPQTQGMMIEITDPDLLNMTGGIVQGMSGSPLIQDGRLIGIVTHVFLNQPSRGYCVYAEWMEQELLPSA